jgi:putative membrane protein
MMACRFASVPYGIVALMMSICASQAANAVSDADKNFVAMVSQGGMYEVALGKVAENQGSAQDIIDQGNTEVHDHNLVGEKLKSLAEANGLEFPNKLNAEFQKRLDEITALSGEKFDAAYIDDMNKIHEADGAAFAKEAKTGSNADLKTFAVETHRIVERHLGELGAAHDHDCHQEP